MPKTKVSHNLPTWFEDYSLSYPSWSDEDAVLRYSKYPDNSIEVAHWNWIPSLTSVVEAVKEFEEKKYVPSM